MNIHTMHLDQEYFELLLNKNKKIEFRILDEKRKRMRIGDEIQFVNQNGSALKVFRKIKDLRTSSDFQTLLNDFSEYETSEAKEKLLYMLRKTYNESEEKELGVIAIVLEE